MSVQVKVYLVYLMAISFSAQVVKFSCVNGLTSFHVLIH